MMWYTRLYENGKYKQLRRCYAVAKLRPRLFDTSACLIPSVSQKFVSSIRNSFKTKMVCIGLCILFMEILKKLKLNAFELANSRLWSKHEACLEEVEIASNCVGGLRV